MSTMTIETTDLRTVLEPLLRQIVREELTRLINQLSFLPYPLAGNVLNRQKILELERKQAEGYARFPVQPDEFDLWENEHAWGDEWHETW